MSLKTVKGKIRSIDKTRQVTRAMEAVSAVKMRKSQSVALDARPYALNALRILEKVSGSTLSTGHPLATVRPEKNVGIILITSDRGLAGSLNASLFKSFERFIAERKLVKENIRAIAIGRRGYEYLSKRGYVVTAHYDGWGDFVDYEKIAGIIAEAKNLFTAGDVDAVWTIYTNFISTLRQEPLVRKMLPLTFESIREIVAGIAPDRGRYAELSAEKDDDRVVEFLVEPDPETIRDALFEELLKIEIYHAILESNASEHSARMIAMKNASDNARDILKGLRLRYNKERQAGITKELTEIVGGMTAITN